jgi:N-acetyl-beta-hexosaminidase
MRIANQVPVVIPEIDLPAHATVITQYDPALAFTCKSMSCGRWKGGENGGWTINFADPYARQWMKDLIGKFLPLFTGPYFHIGTDEIPDGEAPSQCPELVQYTGEEGYPYVGEFLIEWINEMNGFIRSHSKQMQIWSWWEHSPQSLSPHPNSLGYKICVWADEAEDQPNEFLEKYMFQPRAILADPTWNSDNPTRSFPAFLESVEELLIDE